MNFKVVDGTYNDDLIPNFVEMYNHNRTVKEICEKLNLTICNYNSLRKKCFKQGLLKDRRLGRPLKKSKETYRTKATYVQKNGKYWDIRKNGIYYCYVKDYRVGLRIVEKLKECGWDKSKVKEIMQEMTEGV